VAKEDTTKVGVPSVPSPAGEMTPCLTVLSGRSVGHVFKLVSPRYLIGRGSQADIQLDDDGVSREHARLALYPNRVIALSDLGSTNGTFVNGEPVTMRVLSDGDRVQLGATTTLKFSYQDGLEEQLQQRLFEAVTRDALTQAHNKRVFEEHLSRDFSFAKRHGVPLSLAIFDLDHFKDINDRHGHQAGDAVLQQFAKLMMSGVRSEDMVCRIGGEEFAVLMRGTPLMQAMILCEQLRETVAAEGFEARGGRVSLTASVGVDSMDASDHQSAESLFRATDELLYEAKAAGRNCVRGAGHKAGS
jgi:two-component system cell cycle response regulator